MQSYSFFYPVKPACLNITNNDGSSTEVVPGNRINAYVWFALLNNIVNLKNFLSRIKLSGYELH